MSSLHFAAIFAEYRIQRPKTKQSSFCQICFLGNYNLKVNDGIEMGSIPGQNQAEEFRRSQLWYLDGEQ